MNTIFVSIYKDGKEIASVNYTDDGERNFDGDLTIRNADFEFDYLTIQTQGFQSCSSWIQTNYTGFPCKRGSNFVTYHGDFAKFIWNNLPSERFC